MSPNSAIRIVLCTALFSGTAAASPKHVLTHTRTDAAQSFPPEQIRMAYTNTSDCMLFAWATSNVTAADYVPIVQYGQDSGKLSYTATGVTSQYDAFGILSPFLHVARVCGLSAAPTHAEDARARVYGRVYGSLRERFAARAASNTWYYSVGSSVYGVSAPASFQPEGVPSYPVSFTAYGDMGITHSADTAAVVAARASTGLSEFVLHYGDISYADNRAGINNGSIYDGVLNDFFNLVQPAAARVPYMMSVGNHESILDFTAFRYRVAPTLPGRDMMPAPSNATNGGWYYSWNYGPIHFLAFSVEHDYAPGSPQYEFIVQDLTTVDRTAHPWVIAYAHRPMVCSNTFWCPDQMPLRDALEPIFNAPETRVHLFLAGHVHAAEIIYPSINGTVISKSFDNMNVTMHVMSGFPGDIEVCCNGWYDPPPAFSAYKISDFDAFGFTQVTLEDENHATIQLWNAVNNTVLYTVSMSKA